MAACHKRDVLAIGVWPCWRVDPELYPVALGITDQDGHCHLIEASRTLAKQLYLWSGSDLSSDTIESVSLTHLHLGHMDGLGQFGKEVMGRENVRLITSQNVQKELERRGAYLVHPFWFEPIDADNDQGDVPKRVLLGRGVSLEFHRVPHRDGERIGDTHAIVVRGDRASLLFLPDHDSWTKTLALHNVDSIRDWIKEKLKVDIALLDGTFWSLDEIKPKRDSDCIPHPPIEQTLEMLGPRQSDDPHISFVHLNHTNPAIDDDGIRRQIEDQGWDIAYQGQQWEIG